MTAAVAESGFPPYQPRAAHVLARVKAAKADALLVTHPPHLRYLAGFDGTAGVLLIADGGCTLIVDGRYVTAAAALAETRPAGALQVFHADGTFEDGIAAVLGGLPAVRTLAVEAEWTSLASFARLNAALENPAVGGPGRVVLLSLEDIVARSRLVKDASEIAVLRAAARLLSSVARAALDLVRPGRTEHEVAADIDAAVRRAGFERPAFDTIVASGPNSALPHARPGARRIEPADGVVLDFGGVYGGYCVDLTRTVQVPPLTARFGALFDAVREAQAAAIARIRPGTPGSEVDAAAREVLARYGLAEAFLHGTGHGIGLEVHEAPRIGRRRPDRADELLQPGMVFTVEPGVYVPGLGGVRLEDDVLVTEKGCEVLTDVPIDGRGGRAAAGSPFLAGE